MFWRLFAIVEFDQPFARVKKLCNRAVKVMSSSCKCLLLWSRRGRRHDWIDEEAAQTLEYFRKAAKADDTIERRKLDYFYSGAFRKL